MAFFLPALMAVAGLAGSAIATGMKKKTQIPPFGTVADIDFGKSQEQAIASNLANAPAAEQLSDRTSMFNVATLKKMLESFQPGYGSMAQGVSENITAGLKGELAPEDVSAMMARTASKAVGGGYGGSGAMRNLKARDLGLTQYQVTQQALNSAQRWMAQSAATASPAFMSSASMFISPAQRAQMELSQRGQNIAQAEASWRAATMEAQSTAEWQNRWPQYLSSLSGSLMGAGMMGLGGMGSMGSGGATPVGVSGLGSGMSISSGNISTPFSVSGGVF